MHDLIGDNAVGVLFVGSNTSVPFTNVFISENTLTNLDPAPSEAIAVNVMWMDLKSAIMC
jgi:hypothetical protein